MSPNGFPSVRRKKNNATFMYLSFRRIVFLHIFFSSERFIWIWSLIQSLSPSFTWSKFSAAKETSVCHETRNKVLVSHHNWMALHNYLKIKSKNIFQAIYTFARMYAWMNTVDVKIGKCSFFDRRWVCAHSLWKICIHIACLLLYSPLNKFDYFGSRSRNKGTHSTSYEE